MGIRRIQKTPAFSGRDVFRQARAVLDDLDFRAMGQWIVPAVVVGAVMGLVAMVLYEGCEVILSATLDAIAHVHLGAPVGEGGLANARMHGEPVLIAVVLIPGAGGLISGWLAQRFSPAASGSGTGAMLWAHHFRHDAIGVVNSFVKLLASAVFYGMGGSAGREGPTVYIGAGVGSALSRLWRMTARERRVLLLAGVAAGVATMFRTPLSAALFATEVLYSGPDLETDAVLPATVASITAYIVTTPWFGLGTLFTGCTGLTFDHPATLVSYGILAVVASIMVLIMIRVYGLTHELFAKFQNVPLAIRAAIGGLITGGLAAALFAGSQKIETLALLGNGYGLVQTAFLGSSEILALPGLLIGIAFMKILATSASVGSGGSGGTFAPSMVIGATTGAALAELLRPIMPGLVPSTPAFMVVGGAAFLAGVVKTPLTAVLMVSEMTGNYQLLIPGLSVIAVVSVLTRKHRIYEAQVYSRHESPAHISEFVVDLLSDLKVKDVFRRQETSATLREENTLREILDIVSRSEQHVFPVLDSRSRIVGQLRLDDLRRYLGETREMDTIRASDLVRPLQSWVIPSMSLSDALDLASHTDSDELIIVAPNATDRFLGLIATADILRVYEERLHAYKTRQIDERVRQGGRRGGG